MGQFKPMVKMYTDEPSVILKLKKGGKVKSKNKDEGHKPMSQHAHAMHEAMEAEYGKSPKKPSMNERRKAMNPQMFKKGGKVAHRVMGGGMPMGAPMGAQAGAPMGAPVANPAAMQAMAPAALGAMPNRQRMLRQAMVRKALMGMKKGGSTEGCAKLEKELKHHEKLDMSQAHPMRKASGGAIDRDETRTTIEKGAKKFAKTKMHDGNKLDRAHGTGKVKEGKPGGYAMGGTIEGNEKKFENTKMNTAKRDSSGGNTGGVKMGNSGGFKEGGKVSNWENRPADTAKPGKSNTSTGKVKLGNGGGFKQGGMASKKAYATGGNVVDDGKAEKMPHHFISKPVANSLQSGTFAKGGKVDYYTDLAKRLEKNPEKPNLRLVKTHTGPKGHVAKVYKDRDWGEHRVKFFSPEGKHFPDSDYHTDDVSDAHDTAQGQLNRYKKGGKVKFSEGGSEEYTIDYPNKAKEMRGEKVTRENATQENKADTNAVNNLPSKLLDLGSRAIKAFKNFGSTTPTKKRGGSLRC